MSKHYRRIGKLGEGGHGVVFLAEAVSGPAVPELLRLAAEERAACEAAAADAGAGRGGARKRSRASVKSEAGGASAEWDEREALQVAVKKIRVQSSAEGVNMEAVRELRLMQELSHPNVLPLVEVFSRGPNVHLVLQRMYGDLEELLRTREVMLTEAHRKTHMRMILDGVGYVHSRFVLHRDIKPANFLLSRSGALKLADFGLAKVYGTPDRRMTSQTCTLWYRAPELLFGARSYGPAADMWSVGCVFAEIMLRVPLFQGTSEADQLSRIIAFLGSPTEEVWPGVQHLRHFMRFEPREPTDPRQLFRAVPDDALDLLGKMLVWDPSRRISAADALKHPYFTSGVKPAPLSELPRVPERRKKANQ